MKDPELEILLDELESDRDISVADFDGVVHALAFLLPDVDAVQSLKAEHVGSADHAMLVADAAIPNWAVKIRGRANDADGHWRCTLRESDSRDSDAIIGIGRSPVLAHAILAAVIRLGMIRHKDA